MILLVLSLLFSLSVPASGLELEAPEVPSQGEALMPSRVDSFGEGLWELVQNAINTLHPNLTAAWGICARVISVAILLSVIGMLRQKTSEPAQFAGTILICLILLEQTNVLIQLGMDTVRTMGDYGMLLLSVLTAALAAQGGVTASAALYTGTVCFSTVLTNLISRILVPMVYMYLVLSVGYCAVGEQLLKKMADFVKGISVWCLKTILYVFTGYMTVTGVVSGATDAAALKAAKLTISGVVPVVGGILSDATEAVLVGAGVVRASAGIYGLLAVLAVFLGPFLRIGIQTILLKLTGAACGVFAPKQAGELVERFSAAMGLVLAMTASVCILLLISTVCFLKGVG